MVDTHLHSAFSGDAKADIGIDAQVAQSLHYNAIFLTDHDRGTGFQINFANGNYQAFTDPDPKTWTLTIAGLGPEPLELNARDLERLPMVSQSSRLKCVQCWSGRINWQGFRAQDLLRLAPPKPDAKWVRVDCADHYYDFVKVEDLLHPRTLFGLGMNDEPLPPEHGAPLRLVMPAKYGYKSSKLITRLTFVDQGGMGLVADGWPYYSASGDILPGVDHPFEFPDEVRKIKGGEIIEY